MKLMRWKLAYIFLFIFLIFQTNMVLANNIVVPHEWYRYQGASDSDKKGNDCGPACVAMAIQFIKNTFVPIRDIRDYIGPNTATSEKLKNSLQHWGISYNHLSAGSQNVIDAVNNRNHIVICPVAMLQFNPGNDIDGKSDDPALHYDRYCSFTEEHQGHFIVVKGISDDGNWIIVYDPGVWGSYPYPKYWYSNREPKGKERYYKLSEFSNAINSRGIEILAEPHPIITSPLKITPSSPYCIGDTINAEFTIANQSSLPIKFSVLTVGGRDPDNHVSDFTLRQNITLEASKSYDYQGTLTFNKVGNYHFFCTYQTPDGDWNTNVDLGSGLTDEDRIKEIVVIEREAEKEVVYVAEQSNERIQKFTSEGKFITKWGKGGSGDGEFILPRGIAIDSQGNVYVVDANNCCIQKFTSDGKFITKWGKRGIGDGEFDCPIRIAIDSQGNLYVADSYNHRIQKFTSEGKFITKWGDLGSSSGMFRSPQGIAIDSQDDIYVVDEGNDRIQKFTSEGGFVTQWGDYGSGHGFFRSPQGIAIDSEGNIYVADTDNYQIQKFTSEGKFITQWGKEGIGDGEFDEPHGIAIDSQGNIYVADWHNHRIQKFTSEGKFITKWGKEGIGDGEFDCPTGIAISRIYETEELEEKEEEKPPIASDISEELYIEWEKTFGGSENDWARAIIQTTDGGYVIAGATKSKGAGENDAWIIKLDYQGNKIWDKVYGGGEDDVVFSLIQTNDGGYVIAGATKSKGAGENDAWIIKLDNRGNIEWDKTFGGSEYDYAAGAIIQTTDGGYVIAGATKSKGAGKNDAWIIKLDNRGNIEWDKTFGGSEDDLVYSLVQSTDGGYVIAGSTKSKGAGRNDAWIIKLDNRGNIEWDKTFGGSEDDLVYSLIQTNDSGYTIAGYTSSKGAGENDAWIIKLDNRGNIEWDKTFGGNKYEWIISLIQTNDSGYTIAGYTSSKGAGKNGAWIIKLDHQGNKIWDKVYGGGEHDYVFSLIQTNDGGYIVAGQTESKGAGKTDIWVIKLNSKSIETLEEEVTVMEAVEDKIEKEKLLIDSSLYHIECNMPIVSGNIFVVIPVSVSGPADELALILANPEGETDIRFISKRALIDNFETVKLHMGNAPLSEGPYILTVKTVTPEKIIYKKELWFTLPDVSIADAEFTYKITHLGGAYGYAGYYFLEMISLTLINNGDLPAKRDTNARALITLDGKPENMTLLTRRYSISPYKVDFYPPTYIPNGKNKVSVSGNAMYGLKKGNYFVTITIPLIGGETVSLKKALTIE